MRPLFFVTAVLSFTLTSGCDQNNPEVTKYVAKAKSVAYLAEQKIAGLDLHRFAPAQLNSIEQLSASYTSFVKASMGNGISVQDAVARVERAKACILSNFPTDQATLILRALASHYLSTDDRSAIYADALRSLSSTKLTDFKDLANC